MASGEDSAARASIPIEKTTTKIVQIETTTTQSKSRQLCPVVLVQADKIKKPSGQLETKQKNSSKQQTKSDDASGGGGGGRQMFSLKHLARQSRQFASNHTRKRASLQTTTRIGGGSNSAETAATKTRDTQQSSLSDVEAGSSSSKLQFDEQKAARQGAEESREPSGVAAARSGGLEPAPGLEEAQKKPLRGGKKTDEQSGSSSNNSLAGAPPTVSVSSGLRACHEQANLHQQQQQQHHNRDSSSSSLRDSSSHSNQEQQQEDELASDLDDSSWLASSASSSSLGHSDSLSGSDSDSNKVNNNSNGSASSDTQQRDKKEKKVRGAKMPIGEQRTRRTRTTRARTTRNKRRQLEEQTNCRHGDCAGVGPISWQSRQQVTDVDLITYKHLCHLETNSCSQCCQKLTQNFGASSNLSACQCCRNTNSSGQFKPSQSNNLLAQATNKKTNPNNNRLDCPYYELCLTGEEQLIRQKFAWFPPSLKSLQLVEQFFSYFPREKIPYRNKEEVDEQEQGQEEEREEEEQQHESYRDIQVAYQLPRQDISLDYCSYKQHDQSRLAYEQFIERRNSQALDVGTVIELKLAQSNNKTGGLSSSTSGRPTLGEETRKCSLAGGPMTVGLIQSNQRCRRCLVRFEGGQLAVVAPNFLIGTTPLNYHQQQQHQRLDIASTNLQLHQQPASRRASTVSMINTTTALRDSTNSRDNHLNVGAGQPLIPNCAMFHSQCFTCSTCKEFLVDLVYCLRDNKLYCLRHYGESLRPRCSWCQELIFSDEYLKAMNENFHVDHFICRHCDSNLAGQRYVLKEEKPYCIQCYEDNFANQCEDCQKPIGIDSRDLSYKDRHWHDTCFVCAMCTQSLIDKPFGSKDDKVYCADCYEMTFATRCDGCKNPFRAGSKKMEYHGRQWHDSCFCCCVCKNTIGSNSFIPKNDEIYCIKCYEDKYATRCTKCKQVIVSGGVTFRNEPWHRDCFNCCNCNKSLAGQRFTTRDSSLDQDSGKNFNKTNQPHNAFCIDCYGELFAKKCFACTQAITGLGGTRFVTFEERSWHNDCFLCHDCQTSLVGKGFITDGPEAILCSDCARAKLR